MARLTSRQFLWFLLRRILNNIIANWIEADLSGNKLRFFGDFCISLYPEVSELCDSVTDGIADELVRGEDVVSYRVFKD